MAEGAAPNIGVDIYARLDRLDAGLKEAEAKVRNSARRMDKAGEEGGKGFGEGLERSLKRAARVGRLFVHAELVAAAIASLRPLGETIHGVFTLNMQEASDAYTKFLKGIPYAGELVVGIRDTIWGWFAGTPEDNAKAMEKRMANMKAIAEDAAEATREVLENIDYRAQKAELGLQGATSGRFGSFAQADASFRVAVAKEEARYEKESLTAVNKSLDAQERRRDIHEMTLKNIKEEYVAARAKAEQEREDADRKQDEDDKEANRLTRNLDLKRQLEEASSPETRRRIQRQIDLEAAQSTYTTRTYDAATNSYRNVDLENAVAAINARFLREGRSLAMKRAIASDQDTLDAVRDGVARLRGVKATDFLHTANTAIGAFTFAAPGSSNFQKSVDRLVKLQEDELELVERIADSQALMESFQ